MQKAIQHALRRNWAASGRPQFTKIMTEELRAFRTEAFRFHVVGDFYDVEYIQKWIDIVSRFPDIKFFGYTKSWRVPELAPSLDVFRGLPNVQLFASTDFTHTDRPPFSWSKISVEGAGDQCPHDTGVVDTCIDCGRCWKHNQDVRLKLRWSNPWDNWSPKMI